MTPLPQRCDGIWGRASDRIGRFFHSIHYESLVPVARESGNLTRSHKLEFPMRDFIFWAAGDVQVLLEIQNNW